MRAYQRLMRYAEYATASDPAVAGCPSTPGQLELARALEIELRELGLEEITLDENGYLFAAIPSNIAGKQPPIVGFIAHLDVSPDAPSVNVRPRLIGNYDGGELPLSPQSGLALRPADFPVLTEYIGHDLVVSDGLTLLGADDKAGIAEMVTLTERLLTDNSIPHGRVMLAFTPDEEIGRGADRFDVARFGADIAYTVDGGAFGEVAYENFNAAACTVTVRGRGIHPGEAKGRMINAQQVAIEYHYLLPAAERPEYTEGYEGFYHLISMRGEVERAELKYILRDHDAAGLTARKRTMRQAADFLNARYGADLVGAEVSDSYRNMAEQVLKHKHVLEHAYAAIREAGGEPFSRPQRGGTDGAQLSFRGLPCPNLGTGSHNHHGRCEFASVQAMDQVVESLLGIVRRYAADRDGE